jgi:hypothetical protein
MNTTTDTNAVTTPIEVADAATTALIETALAAGRETKKLLKLYSRRYSELYDEYHVGEDGEYYDENACPFARGRLERSLSDAETDCELLRRELAKRQAYLLALRGATGDSSEPPFTEYCVWVGGEPEFTYPDVGYDPVSRVIHRLYGLDFSFHEGQDGFGELLEACDEGGWDIRDRFYVSVDEEDVEDVEDVEDDEDVEDLGDEEDEEYAD